jgi:ADP-ribose pyrophosphatase YjhB (NUDIX family)
MPDAVLRFDDSLFQVRVVAVIEHGERVLLHSFDGGVSWSMPGGRLAVGESFRSCIAREMAEELDVEVTVGEIRWVVENFFDIVRDEIPARLTRHHEIGVYVAVGVPEALVERSAFQGIEHRPDGTSFHMDFRWFDRSELAGLTLYPESVAELLVRRAPLSIVEDDR